MKNPTPPSYIASAMSSVRRNDSGKVLREVSSSSSRTKWGLPGEVPCPVYVVGEIAFPDVSFFGSRSLFRFFVRKISPVTRVSPYLAPSFQRENIFSTWGWEEKRLMGESVSGGHVRRKCFESVRSYQICNKCYMYRWGR